MIQNDVYLEPIEHKYFNRHTGEQLTSVSKVLDSLEEKFDVEGISKTCAGRGKYKGMTQQMVKDAWKFTRKKATDHGTRIHEALERYTKEFLILEQDRELESMIKNVCKDYIAYKRTYDECCLYYPEYKIAGTADKILVTKSRAGIVDIEDYKTNISKGIYYSNDDNKYMKGPANHLQQCNFTRYALQLSIYGVMWEKLTGNKIGSMWIRFIAPVTFIDTKIMVPYMRDTAIEILKWYSAPFSEMKVIDDNLNEIPNFD